VPSITQLRVKLTRLSSALQHSWSFTSAFSFTIFELTIRQHKPVAAHEFREMAYDRHAKSGDLVACVLGFCNILGYLTPAFQRALSPLEKPYRKVLNVRGCIGYTRARDPCDAGRHVLGVMSSGHSLGRACGPTSRGWPRILTPSAAGTTV
jgi:hypothetical protein